jgi:alanyl-tRNA synthetase
MYTNFGFPPEITIEELQGRGYDFDKEEAMKSFNERFKKHQDMSRNANKNIFVSPLSL